MNKLCSSDLGWSYYIKLPVTSPLDVGEPRPPSQLIADEASRLLAQQEQTSPETEHLCI